MKVVVTGAAGFVGSSICDALLKQGHEVVGIDCFIDYYPREIKESNLRFAQSFETFAFIEGNLLNLPLEKILEGSTYVYHQAAQAGVRASWGSDFDIYTDNNILGTQRVLEAAKHPLVRESLKKIVYASSSSVYGDAETYPTKETALPCPLSPYGVSKLAAEHLMGLYNKEFSVPSASLRYFTVYGPRQRPDMAFNRFSSAALLGKEITIYGDGEQSRDFTFIDDIVAANISAAESDTPELVYNVGGGTEITVNKVLALLSTIVGAKLKVNYLERQHGDVRHTGADTTRAQSALGYKPLISLEEGLRAEVEWMDSLLQTQNRKVA